MNDEIEKLSGNLLNAQELLKNKGIRYEAWDEYEKATRVLPKTGQKQFEPNNSWLQNMQIEKGLKNRKDLLSIERVERCSQLAIAEWLPWQKRARVTKRSGQDWTNFGLEINSALYLIPEEALLLLELNCLELTWDGVALSVQQAYDALIGADDSECSVEEYRVYSQLVRQGYRMQRFRYEQSLSVAGKDVPVNQPLFTRKKMIINPENGLRMSESLTEMNIGCTGEIKEASENSKETLSNPSHSLKNKMQNLADATCINEEKQSRDKIDEDVKSVIETIVHGLELAETRSMVTSGTANLIQANVDCKLHCIVERSSSRLDEQNVEKEYDGKDTHAELKESKKLLNELDRSKVQDLPGPSNLEQPTCNKKKKNIKNGIISEEICLGNIKIISDVSDMSTKLGNVVQKWPGSRILRNVKLLPKRNDKLVPSTSVECTNIFTVDIGENECTDSNLVQITSENEKSERTRNSSHKRKDDVLSAKPSQTKKSKLEVIELSDDEVEEIPLQMSRMEMLNLLPNIACQTAITENISKRYLPRNVRPQKDTYRYVRWEFQKILDRDKRLRINSRNRENSYKRNCENRKDTSNKRTIPENDIIPFRGQNPSTHVLHRNNTFPEISSMTRYHHMSRQTQMLNAFMNANYGLSLHQNKFPFNQNVRCFSRSTSFQQNTVHNYLNLRSFDHPSLYSGTNWSNTFARDDRFSIQVNNYTDIAVMDNMARTSLSQNYFRPNFSQNNRLFPQQDIANFWQQRLFRGLTPDLDFYRNQAATNTQRSVPRSMRNVETISRNSGNYDVYKSSFTIFPGVMSWKELKKQWLDMKTITIDDGDCNNGDSIKECSEIQVIEQLVKPLVSAKNVKSLSEVYEKLQIIKPAAEKIVRRKKSDYKISYNVYSSTQHFRKANPGTPMCRLVITRQRGTAFVQPAELNRLLQDSKAVPIIMAYASGTSVTFIQPGIISVPNLT